MGRNGCSDHQRLLALGGCHLYRRHLYDITILGCVGAIITIIMAEVYFGGLKKTSHERSNRKSPEKEQGLKDQGKDFPDDPVG